MAETLLTYHPILQTHIPKAEVRMAPGSMGYGLFATAAIAANETIFLDTAIFSFPNDTIRYFATAYMDAPLILKMILDNGAFVQAIYDELKVSSKNSLRSWLRTTNNRGGQYMQTEHWEELRENIMRAYSIFKVNAAGLAKKFTSAFYPIFSRYVAPYSLKLNSEPLDSLSREVPIC